VRESVRKRSEGDGIMTKKLVSRLCVEEGEMFKVLEGVGCGINKGMGTGVGGMSSGGAW